MKNYRAGIYLRLSKEHTEESNSIEAQRVITTDYAKKNGFNIVKEYQDNGYSGILDNRPALNEMIMDILRGFINMVIVKDISRLTRDKNKTGWYTEVFFPDNDIRFISVTEFIDTGYRYEIDDTIMLRGIANQIYLEDISNKIRANKKAMKNTGLFVEAHAPYGYKLLKENRHKIIIDDEVSDNIRLIYNMYIDGYTGTEIAEYLNTKKIENPSTYFNLKNKSDRWCAETVTNILSNPFYVGNTVVNKYITDYKTKSCRKNTDRKTWIIKENTHDSVISKEKYELVQKIKKSKHKDKKIKYVYLLKDLLYCGDCNHKLQYKIYKSKDETNQLYNYNGFICGIKYKKKYLCENKNYINEMFLNSLVIEKVIERFHKIELDKVINEIIKRFKENRNKDEEYKKYKSNIKNLERSKRELYREKCEEYITEIEFKNGYNEIKEKISYYKLQIENIEENYNKYEERIKDLIYDFQYGKNIDNDILKYLIDRIEVYSNNQINIIFNF